MAWLLISRPRSHKRRWLNAWVPDAKWSVSLGGPEHRKPWRPPRRVSHQSLSLTRWVTCRNRLNAHAGLIEWFIIAAFHLNYWKLLQLDDKTEISTWAFSHPPSSVREPPETELKAGSKLLERWHKRGSFTAPWGGSGRHIGASSGQRCRLTGLFCVALPSSKDLGIFHLSSEEASAHVLGEDEWMFDSLLLKTRWPHWESHFTVLRVTSLSNHSEATHACVHVRTHEYSRAVINKVASGIKAKNTKWKYSRLKILEKRCKEKLIRWVYSSLSASALATVLCRFVF